WANKSLIFVLRKRMYSPRELAREVVKRLLPLLILGSTAVIVGKILQDPSSAQGPEATQHERKLKIKGLKDMPLEIRAIKNLESENWVNELEIEVKNLGNKPIYFIYGHISFPDDRIADQEVAVPFTFGKAENVEIKRLADVNDPHLNPQEVFVYT